MSGSPAARQSVPVWIDARAASLRQVTRASRKGGHALTVTGFFEGHDLVRVVDAITQDDGAFFRTRYDFWRGRLVATDVEGVMLSRPGAGVVQRADIRWHYLYRPNGRLLAGRMTIDGHSMPPSEETVRAGWRKARAFQGGFAER